MSIRNRLQCYLTFCVLGIAFTQVADGGTRVAVVSGDRDESVSKVVALALVNLSQNADVELIERDDIRRVLDEQKLNASGIVDVSQAISLGKLLKADLFAIVESAAGKQVVPSVVVFDARTGIRYQDAALQSGVAELDKAAESLATAIQAAILKRNRRQRDLRMVGFIGVRNADLPRSQDALCDTVTFLVERALPQSADIAVLERRRLERVTQERSLPGTEDVTDLLASLSTIDLEVSRGPDGKGLRGTALVKDATKNVSETITVTVAEVDAVTLASELQKKLVEHLQAAPVGFLLDRVTEAGRFDGEAVHLYSHLKYADAVRSAEAAFALDPANEDYLERLSQYLVNYAVYLYSPKEVGYVKSGERAWMDNRVAPRTLETLLICGERGVGLNLKNKRFTAHFALFNNSLGALCTRLCGLRKATALTGASTKALDDFLLLCQQRSLDYCESWARRTEANPELYDGYAAAIHGEMGILRAASLDIDAYADLVLQTAGRWVTVTKDIPPQFNKTDGSEIVNMMLHAIVGKEWHWEADGRGFVRKMMPTFLAMQAHSRPLVKLYGHFGQIRGDVLLGQLTEEEGFARFASVYRPLAESIITSPEPWDPARTRFATYLAWHTAIEDMPGKSMQQFYNRELVEYCNFMTARNELVYKALQLAFGRLDRPTSLKIIAQSLVVVDSPLFQESANERARLRSFLKTTEQGILQAQPELAAAAARLPWSKATKLFDVGNLRELSDVAGCVVVDEHLYSACLQFENEQSYLTLVKTALNDGAPVILAKAGLALPAGELAPHLRHRFVSSISVDAEHIYLATKGAGVVVFPIKGGAPRRIDTENGLPSRKVRSLAVYENSLYAGFDEGYLIAFDLKTQQTDVIASSRRKQKLSPFDDGPVFRVPALAADPNRRRVVFVVGKSLWQLTPADGKMSQVLDLIAVQPGTHGPKLDGTTIDWASPVRNNRLLVSNVFDVVEIDLERDRAIEIHSADRGIFPTWPPHLVLNGALWSGSFSRLDLDKLELQILPPPEKSDSRFNPFFLETLPPRQIITADSRTVWRLDLDEKASAPASAGAGKQSPTVTPMGPDSPAAASADKCVVKVVVLSEDKLPVDPDSCYCQFWSWTNPYEQGGETRYRNAAGLGARPIGGLATTRIEAGMIGVGIQAKGYAPVVLGPRPSKPNETLDLGTVQLKRGFTWRLKIVNPTGQPVPDAEITALCKYCREATRIVGNSDGISELSDAAAEEYSVTVRAIGHQPKKFERVKASQANLATLTLEPAHPTTGRLLSEDGSPVVGARIRVMSDQLQNLLPDGRVAATTGPDGSFSLDQLNDGWRHPIRVDVENRTRLILTDVPSAKAGLEWRLQPLISLTGTFKGIGPKDSRRIRYEQCAVNSNGEAIAFYFSGETQADGDGRFKIENLLPGVIRIVAFRRFVDISLPRSRDDYVLDLAAPTPPRVVADLPVPAPTVVPKGKCAVRAVVVNEQGEALQGNCWITSNVGGGSSGRGMPIGNGIVNVDVEPGQIGLGIQIRGYAPVAAGLKEGKAGDVVDFGTITVTRGFTWNVSVVDEENRAVPNAVLSATCKYCNEATEFKSNAEGQAMLSNAAENDYEINIRAAGFQPKGTVKITARTTGDIPKITLKRANPTTGIIVDDNDRPVAGARILPGFLDSREFAKTDTDGRFVLDQLADKQVYAVRVEVEGKLRLVVTNLQAGQPDLSWKLKPSLILAGRVNGMPAEGNRRLSFSQYVTDHRNLLSGSHYHGYALVDSEGTFTIEGLIPGVISLAGFQRTVDVDLTESRTDYVLDLTAPDPTKPHTMVTLQFENDGMPVGISGVLKGVLMQPRTGGPQRPSSMVSQLLNIPVKDQSSVDVKAYVPGSLRWNMDGLENQTHCFASPSLEFKADESKVVVKMLPLGSISGTVRDAEGAPVAGAAIYAGPSGGGPGFVIAPGKTDQKGEFTIRIPLETDVVIQTVSGNRFARSESLRIAPGTTQNLNLRLAK